MLTVLLKEINSFFNSLIGYIVMVVFLMGVGLVTWVFPQTNVMDGGFANLTPLFELSPYVFMFLIPAITMRTFAEEKKSGTMELMLTQPLSEWQIILGKYFSSLLLALFAVLPTLVYYYTVYELGSPRGNIDTAAVVGSYIGLSFLAATFTAVGILASSITENQIVAFIAAVFFSFILFIGITSLSSINVWSEASFLLGKLGADYHYEAMSRGLIDSRNLIYFSSVIVAMLGLTKLVLQSRKWE